MYTKNPPKKDKNPLIHHEQKKTRNIWIFFFDCQVSYLYSINAKMYKGLSVEEMKNANMRVNLEYMLLHNH